MLSRVKNKTFFIKIYKPMNKNFSYSFFKESLEKGHSHSAINKTGK